MKREVMGQFLSLKKETIARLSYPEMRNLRVGCTTDTIGAACDDTQIHDTSNTCWKTDFGQP
ncbi:MAG: hypothetical protein PVH61_16630 [Candidatus Aminicenantes bacterium]|jgi:hypothetical protein